jgi:hypothetical protein
MDKVEHGAGKQQNSVMWHEMFLSEVWRWGTLAMDARFEERPYVVVEAVNDVLGPDALGSALADSKDLVGNLFSRHSCGGVAAIIDVDENKVKRFVLGMRWPDVEHDIGSALVERIEPDKGLLQSFVLSVHTAASLR